MQKIADEALKYAKQFVSQGRTADYIPELCKVDPNRLGYVCRTRSLAKKEEISRILT